MENIKLINRNKTVQNSHGQPVVYGYKIAKKPTGEFVVRADGVYALECVGGLLAGLTGHVDGSVVQTIGHFIKDANANRVGVTDDEAVRKEIVSIVPVYIDHYKDTVYVLTENIEFV